MVFFSYLSYIIKYVLQKLPLKVLPVKNTFKIFSPSPLIAKHHEMAPTKRLMPLAFRSLFYRIAALQLGTRTNDGIKTLIRRALSRLRAQEIISLKEDGRNSLNCHSANYFLFMSQLFKMAASFCVRLRL